MWVWGWGCGRTLWVGQVCDVLCVSGWVGVWVWVWVGGTEREFLCMGVWVWVCMGETGARECVCECVGG